MTKKGTPKPEILQLDYRPPKSYWLDLEIFSASDFRQKGSKEKRRSTHKYSFYMLVCVTQGVCSHLVDFKPIPCEQGSLLVIRPGQTHNFGFDEDWDGWIILFKSEFIQPSVAEVLEVRIGVALGNLPEHIRLNETELHSVINTIMQMKEDTRIDAQLQDVHILVLYQLYSLLTRLSIYNGRQVSHAGINAHSLRRFELFRQLLEKNFARYHQVAEYAKQLGCTEKSLTRATLEATAMNAKSLISARISMEAKRLLVHTDLSITHISEKLGFEEATYFIKYFKRINGLTPIGFRKMHWIFSNSLDQNS